MSSETISTLREVLANIAEKPTTAWVYLPKDGRWDLDSKCAVLESEEVPPEQEDDPDAGVPEFARREGLKQALPVTTMQDIVTNFRTQKPEGTPEDILEAFLYYYEHDAFMTFSK